MKELIEKYGIIGTAKRGEQYFPIINIPMMTDERWQELAVENAVHNFKKFNKREPASAEEAVKWQKRMVMEIEKEAVI